MLKYIRTILINDQETKNELMYYLYTLGFITKGVSNGIEVYVKECNWYDGIKEHAVTIAFSIMMLVFGYLFYTV